jgi:hypothetical protein
MLLMFSRPPQLWKEFWQQLLVVLVLFVVAYGMVSLIKMR